MKIKMTFDEYVKESDRFESYHTKTYWPTPEQIEIFKKDPERWVVFACYLYEYGETPKDDEEKSNKKLLKQFIDEFLEIT